MTTEKRNNRLAYFDCFSGISGDMTLGALVDLGVPLQWLQGKLSKILVAGFNISTTPVVRNGIKALKVQVQVDDDKNSRDFKEIKSLVENCPLSDRVKTTSLTIFEKLAHAEAAIHGCSPEEVHFHEVGGIDAIVDVVGTALCLENLGIETCVASKIPLGSGFVKCRHGKLPVPVPATLAILKDVPVYGTETKHELVTPTGAAIIATLAQSFEPIPDLIIKKVGYGAGQRNLESRPNLLRVISGTLASQPADLPRSLHMDQVSIVETCVDDMNPEFFGYMMERLFEDGALDVYWIPIYMKKNRPGTMVQVLCKKDRRNAVIRRILSETTSLGLRFYDTNRCLLGRDRLKIKSSFGLVPVKRVRDPQGAIRIVPEYEACKNIALKKKIPLRAVYETIAKEAAEEDLAEK